MKINLSKGNTKLGKILSFSISALKSCPTKTSWCEKHCYAKRLENQYPNVKQAYNNNFEVITDKDFTKNMIAEIKKANKNNLVRFHVSGDFNQVSYIYKWISIAKQLPEITFYGYTRAWEDVNLLPHLGILNKQPNVILFASTDITTTKNIPKTFRIAYAGDTKPNGIQTTACPQQNKKVVNCTDCKLCFTKKAKTNIYFKTH